jgi:FlaG/FlaF family flagellin (archaellin)
MKKLFRKNRKGISTVIATIIIVAISIVMAIAVAYWALGIGGSFTRFERVQYVSAYATDSTTVHITVKNTGTAPATISSVLINGLPLETTGAAGATYTGTCSLVSSTSLQPGDNVTGTIAFTKGTQSGMSIDIKLQTVAGNQYPEVVVLP